MGFIWRMIECIVGMETRAHCFCYSILSVFSSLSFLIKHVNIENVCQSFLRIFYS